MIAVFYEITLNVLEILHILYDRNVHIADLRFKVYCTLHTMDTLNIRQSPLHF